MALLRLEAVLGADLVWYCDIARDLAEVHRK